MDCSTRVEATARSRATRRLFEALPVLIAHRHTSAYPPSRALVGVRVEIDPEGPDVLTTLSRVRFAYLAEVGLDLQGQRLPEMRVDRVLNLHRVVWAWAEDLAGQSIGPLGLDDEVGRAVLDTVVAVLLWHVTWAFHPTQRLVTTCRVLLDRGAPREAGPVDV